MPSGVAISGDPELWGTVRRMLTAEPAPTIELCRTWHGEPAARIVSAPAGRGVPRERFVVVANTLADLFRVLGQAVQ